MTYAMKREMTLMTLTSAAACNAIIKNVTVFGEVFPSSTVILIESCQLADMSVSETLT